MHEHHASDNPSTDEISTSSTDDQAGVERLVAAHPRMLLDPQTLQALRQRAQANDPNWIALRQQCDTYLQGHVEWPDGIDYPDNGSIGEGYQGDEYFAPVANLGLAYRVAQTLDPARAKQYAAKGVDVLVHMSAPEGDPHAPPVERDQVYGIRFYGVGMALGFDWLYDAMTPAQRSRVSTALNRWIDAFETKSFASSHPQGNYFAGYYAAKALTALATEGDNPRAAAHWDDFINRVHGKMVQPFYTANLEGGGWPEGWNYGPLATFNMLLPVLAAKTAKGIDLVHAAAPFRFPSGAAEWLMYNLWPDLKHVDERGTMRSQPEPASAPVAFITRLAGMLPSWGDPLAPTFHRFARDVQAAGPDTGPASWRRWSDVLFWNPAAPEADYTTKPLAHYARGMEIGSVRSSWQKDAVWGSFNAGPYTNNPNSGEELFDSGSLAIARGNRPFLTNAAGQLFRGTKAPDQFVYEDNYGDHATRGLFNVFYTQPAPTGQYWRLRADGARTHMQAFDAASSYVFMRASQLEDMYVRPNVTPTISSWTRDVFYLRPRLFVVYDRTTTASASVGQWMRFHFAGAPTRVADPSPGVSRYDVGSGATYAGTMNVLLPARHTEQVTRTVFEGSDVSRVDVKPGAAVSQNQWLAVFDAATAPAQAARAIRLSGADGNVLAGSVAGVLLQSADQSFAVLSGTAGAVIAGPIRYRLPAKPTVNVVADLAPNATYTVKTSSSPTGVLVEIAPGSGPRSSAAGVLSFTTRT